MYADYCTVIYIYNLIDVTMRVCIHKWVHDNALESKARRTLFTFKNCFNTGNTYLCLTAGARG